MTSTPQDYESLVEKLFDDRLSDNDLQSLNDALRESPEARAHYWHLVMLEGHLADLPGWIAGQQYATKLAFSETLEAFIEMESNAEAELQSYPVEDGAMEQKHSEGQQVTWHDVKTLSVFGLRSLVRHKATWGIAAAAVVCLAALVYTNWFSASESLPPFESVVESDQETPRETPRPVKPMLVAIVKNYFGHSEDSEIAPGKILAQGHTLELLAGAAVQLEYPSGASVILQGPGRFELLDLDRVGMQQGRITALVPPQAKGFTVATPRTDFIDHGTEFVVTIDENGQGEVVVLDGLIEAKQAATVTEQSAGKPESVMLSEGVGGRLVPGEALPKSVEPVDAFDVDRYARNWDDVVYRPRLSGQITYVSEHPSSLKQGDATSDLPLFIPEQRGVVLTEDLHLNANKANAMVMSRLGADVDSQKDYVIETGTALNSFLIHFERPLRGTNELVEREFEIEFSGRILGIVQVHKYQMKTDDMFGHSAMQYPTEGTLRGAADPPGHPNHDSIWVSDDMRTLTVKMRLTGMDQIRVLVENTDP